MSYPRELYETDRIIPLIGKIPRNKGWYEKGRPWSEASKAPMVERWGCIMGRGLLTLDVDPGGDVSLATMPTLPATLEARTPRGGRHLVFRGTARTMVGVLPKVDVRGERGQIAVEPTAGYEWINELPIAEAPAWLLRLCEPFEREPATDRPDDLKADVATAIRNAQAAPIPTSGQVGPVMWELAMQTIRGYGCTIEQAVEVMEEHWGARMGAALLAEEHGGIEHTCTRVEELGSKEWGYLLAKPAPTETTFEPVDEFLARHIEPPREIVWKLQSAQLAFLYGGANASKTWLALELTRQALARGKRVLYAVEEGHPAYLQTRFRDMGLKGPALGVSIRKGLMLPGSAAMLAAAVKAHRADLLIVDPLSDTIGHIDERDNTEMHPVREALKTLVVDTDACVLVLHHSSKFGSRLGASNQGMAMENMRGASVLMGAADLMIEVRRSEKEEGVSEVEVTKNRNGPLEFGGRLELNFNGGQRVTFLPGEAGQSRTEQIKAERQKEELEAKKEAHEDPILNALRKTPGLSKNRVAILTGKAPDTVTRTLSELEEKGLVYSETGKWYLNV